MKFCPGADCNKCISSDNSTLKEVACDCGTKFCFGCILPVHRPCECSDVTKWKQSVLVDEANEKWLTLHTKICPFCKKHVERSDGCNFMACKPPGGCGKSFCYVCSKPWEPDHSDHFNCNVMKK
jgi:ariadne-1